MAMMKKRMTFHGVDYIVVPVELWEEGVNAVNVHTRSEDAEFALLWRETLDNMLAYEGSNEPTELTDE